MEFSEYLDCKNCNKRHLSPFCNASTESIDQIEHNKACTSYKKGSTIIHEGGHPLGIYCINKGKIKLVRSTDDGLGESIVRLISAGDILGYKALLSGSRYNATAIALEDSDVCFIPKDTFLEMLKTDSNLTMDLLAMVSKELAENEERVTNLANKPVRERAAEALLFIKAKYGVEADGETLNVRLSREDLSKIIGTATESTIRFLSEFKKDNIIAVEGKKILIKNLKKLTQIARIED